MVNIAIFTGGTMGHIKPAVEIAKELRMNGCGVDFIVNKDVDDDKLRNIIKERFEIRKITAGYFKKFGARMILFPFKIIIGFFQSLNILKKNKYDAVIGMGAYISFPGVLAGWMLGKRIYLCEQNVYPGRANRLLARFADKIYLGFEESKKYFDGNIGKCEVYGNPVDKKLFEISRINPKRTLLVFGGSNGASDINDVIVNGIDNLIDKNTGVIHITGKVDYDRIVGMYKMKKVKLGVEVNVIEFTNDMNAIYKKAEVIVCRAGAGSLFEINATGRKAIFVPHPRALDRHQDENAKIAADLGYISIGSSELNDKLVDKIIDLIDKNAKIKSVARKDSAYKITKDILINIKNSRKS